MAENKNQSIAGWPSVTGSRTTGLDLRGLNPQLQRNAKVLEAYQKRYASDVSAVKQMGDATARLTKITQDINAKNFARQDQLLTVRQGNFQRMNEMYGNYFQQFGNVLNESALKFLDEHSNIGVPTLTAIMAGYEHAKASRAQQELAMLDRQAKMAEAAYALDKQRADLEALKDQNAALSQQTSLENQIKAIDAINKSQNQYYSDVARVYGAGVAGGRGTGVTGAGGLGSGSAAGSFQAPVTGSAGVAGAGAVADGGATGFVDPSNPQVAALNKMIDDSKAAQIAGQASQLGPLATQARTDSGLITQWSDIIDPVIGAAAISGIPVPFTKNTVGGLLGNSLVKAGSTTARGYFDTSELTRAQSQFKDAQDVLNRRKSLVTARERQYEQYLRRSGISPSNFRSDIDFVKEQIRAGKSASEIGISNREYNFGKRLLDAEDLRTGARESIKNAGKEVSRLTNIQQEASKASTWSRRLGSFQRGAGKLLKGGVVGKVALAGELLAHFGDDLGGAVSAAGGWAYDRYRDLTGQTTLEEAQARGTALEVARRRYYEGRDDTRVFGNALYNQTIGRVLGPSTIGIQNDDVAQVVDRLHELGWRDPEIINNSINGLFEEQRNNPTAFRQAMEALYQYDPHLDPTTGRMGQEININPLEFFNRVYSNSVYRKQAFIQENKAAQNQQVTDQEIMRDQRIADALARKPKFFAGMAEYLTRVGREAGYDFDEADAAAMMGRLIEMNQAMESGGKFGAVGANTSTGTAKSRHQFMDMTFDQLRKWMLEDDNKAGGIFFDDNERNALRQARTANDLDNEQFGHLLDLMVPYYLMKDNVNIGKFGKGNPNIGSLQALVDLSQMTKDIGISPYLDSSMNALRMAGFGRFKAGKEFDETLSRFNRDWQGPIWSAQFGDRATSNGAYRSRDMYLQDFANNGILIGPYQNKVPANEYLQWVNEYFVVDKDGNITGIKEGANPKHLDKWREENGLTRVQKVGVPQQNKEYNLGNLMTGQTVPGEKGKYFYYENFPNFRGYAYANIEGLIPEFANRLGNFSNWYKENIGKEFYGSSGHRSKEDQAKVKASAGAAAAEPGYSYHGSGAAFDADWESALSATRKAIKNNPDLLKKYGAKNAADLLDKGLAQYGLTRNLKHRADEQHHIQAIEDDVWRAAVNTELLGEHRKTGMLGTQPGSYYMRKNQGLTLPSLPALRQAQPFSPALWTDPAVEPANQGIVDPLDLSAFDGMMPGGVNFSPTNYGVAMEQMQQQYPQEGYIDESMIVW